MAKDVRDAALNERFEMRLTAREKRDWDRAREREGFHSLGEWVRVHMKKVVQTT